MTLARDGGQRPAEETVEGHRRAKTVETHVGNLFGKLGLLPAAEDHRRVLAVLTYLRR